MALRESARDLALLLARWALAGLFLYTAWRDMQGLGGVAARLEGAGYPAPTLLAWGSMLAKLLGGASLVFGALTPLGCLALVLFLIPATYSFHLVPAGQLAGREATMQLIQTFKNVALIGGLLALMFAGPGRLSVDHAILRGGRR